MGNIFKPTSYRKGAFAAVSATLVWKILSFANALLLAFYFGASYKSDVYFYLIMVIGFGLTFMQRLNQAVLIPEAMFLREEDPVQGRRFVTMGLYFYVLLAAAVAAAGMLFPVRVWTVFSRFDTPLLVQQHALLAWGAVLFGLQLLTYYLTAVCEMFKFFKVSWLGILNALCPLICLLVLGNQTGIISMVYGFTAAQAVQVAVLLGVLKKELAWDFRPAWVPLRARARRNIVTGQILAVVEIVNSLLPVYLMSAMGAGVVSALNYCRQLTDSPTEIITSRVAAVTKIQFTENGARGEKEAFNRNFLRVNHLLLIILTPLAVFSCWFAPQIVELFFRRGHFSAEAARNTICFLRPMLFTLVLLVPAAVQSNTIAAWGKVKESFPYSLGVSVGFALALAVLMPRLGAFSFPYISIGGLLAGAVVSYFLFKKYFPFVSYAKSFADMGRILAVNACALVPAAAAKYLLPLHGAFWVLLVCGTVFMAGYILLLRKTGHGKQFLSEIKQLEQ